MLAHDGLLCAKPARTGTVCTLAWPTFSSRQADHGIAKITPARYFRGSAPNGTATLGRSLLLPAGCGTLQRMALRRPIATVPGTALKRPDDGPSEARRIALPKNLSQTLQFVSDSDLEALRLGVERELERRRPEDVPKARTPTNGNSEQDSGPGLPAGRVSLIRASYHAGMKPTAIARTLQPPMSVVDRVLGSGRRRRSP